PCLLAIFAGTIASQFILHPSQSSPPTNAPHGSMFDNAVFVAMENQNYCTGVIVCGLGSSSFIPNLAAAGSIDTNYQGYGVSGRSISGCSAAVYLALTSGSHQCKSSGYWL